MTQHNVKFVCMAEINEKKTRTLRETARRKGQVGEPMYMEKIKERNALILNFTDIT